ncbi:hypothetical protein L211DRAFT_392514 [Terfezia boudieri ATCC MYA-4762]|uniref:Uncharacterized protein n=1 Tax=Terfezia boudieri ATCC MYA-4762 TaxID=1051890 RepID=A0A3N4M3J2_9PEZI|nr:hypothetical protein L211DRAFT_392514 [Terfezia boudieri ATCC MYA-4762]
MKYERKQKNAMPTCTPHLCFVHVLPFLRTTSSLLPPPFHLPSPCCASSSSSPSSRLHFEFVTSSFLSSLCFFSFFSFTCINNN